ANETIVSSGDHSIEAVIPRDHVYTAQAPQSFRLGEILSLYDRAVAEGEHDTIDSCSLMYRYDRKLYRVDGSRSNIKITTAEDFSLCRTFFEIIENQQIADFYRMAVVTSPVIGHDLDEILDRDLPWDRLFGSTVLVTGASGMLPSYAVYSLLALNDRHGAGITVHGLVRNEAKARRLLA